MGKLSRKRTHKDTLVFRESSDFRVILDDFYDWFSYYSWDKPKKNKVSKKQYKIFINTFFELICKKIVLEHFIFIMPYKLGSIFIKKIKKKENQKTVDFGHYRKTGEKRAHANLHSFGFRYKMRHDKTLANFTNQGVYVYVPGNYLKRLLFKTIKERSEDDTQKSYNSH